MSEFLDFQAEESDISHTSSDTDSSEPRRKKAKKMKEKRKKRARISDDEDDEEDDDKAIQQEMEGFVVAELSDEEQQEKSDESDSELDEELSEDDIDLVNDNLGLRTGGRIRVMEDDDDVEESSRRGHHQNRGRENDADSVRSYDDDRDSIRSESENESVDNFIVDDNEDDDRRHARHKHKKPRNRGFEFSSHAMEEANEVFGINSINYSSLYAEEEYENEKGTRTIRRLKSSMKKGISLDPTELIMNNMTDEAQRIASIDAPERFIRRKRAIDECTDDELKAEALWIYENVFDRRYVTDVLPQALNKFRDDEYNIFEHERDYILKGIATVLSFIHNQKFEVPYIYTYRHESFNETTHEAKFGQNDLWEIYFADETYWNFMDRKNNLKDIMIRMDKFISHEIENGHPNLRRISSEDYGYLDRATADETLTDIQSRFSLYYGPYFNKMYTWEQKENALSEQISEKLKVSGQYKLSSRSDLYHLALTCHLDRFSEKFGLTASEIAVNCSTNLSNPTEARHTETDPSTEASKYICENFPSEKHVVDGGVLLLARELASHPDFRHTMRLEYQKAALITIRCTKRGRSEIQAGHPLYGLRYITDKPIFDLKDYEFLYIVHAERQGFVKYEIHVDKKLRTADQQYVGFIDGFIDKKVFYTEKMSEVAKEWNKLRAQVLTVALERFLFKVFEKELIKKMLEESTICVVSEIKSIMNNKFNYKPYQPDLQDDEDEDDDESIRHGIRIMSIVTTTKEGEATTAVILDGEGNLLDMDVFPYITNRYSEGPKRHNPNGLAQNIDKLKEFIIRKKPHAIALAAENLDSLRIKTLISEACEDLKRRKDIRRSVFVDIVDPGVSLAYCYSDMAENEFSGQTYASKQAISLGRFFIDPLVETTHLFNYQKDFLKLKIHPLQDTINKSIFIKYCVSSIMNFVNKLGVDINRCIEQEHVYNMLQFVCGLGPAKASHIKKSILACEAGLATTRAVIVTVCGMGTNIYMNSSAFIKIDTVKVRERTDEMVNELDCSRVHPEHYSLAAKIASDALDMEVDADESQISAIIEEVLKKPKTLEVLNQSSLIKYLSHTEFGDTGYLVPFIIKELMDRYADARKPINLNPDDIFKLLVHEDKNYYPVGKLVSAVFRNIAYKRLREKDQERANGYPVHNSNNWRCRFCGNDKFYDSTSVINHIRTDECPGNVVGLRGDLPNGISVFVPINRIIDGCDNLGPESSRHERDDLNRKLDEAKTIANNVKKGSQLIGRITEEINTEKFSILLSCRPCDLQAEDNRDQLDKYFDYEVYKSDIERDTIAKQTPKTAGGYFKRVIAHPHFYNVSFKQAENILSQKEPGESVIRPSSKHIDHLCVTWKVTDDIYQHVDVIEKDKPQPFSLGKTLIIDEEDYEDLEEILARYIQPMARLVRYVMDHKCYKEGIFAEEDSRLQEQLSAEKSQNPSRIPYFFVPSRKYPGKFVIAYQPRQKMLKEYFSVKPNGFRFRQQIFPTLDYMMSWFKSNFNKMPPR